MTTEVIYTARDGKKFSDKKECEDYEKRLGTEPGTVARARIDLKELGEDRYVSGILKVRHDGITDFLCCKEQCLDNILKDYVDVNELDMDKRWIRYTVSDVLRHMEKYNGNYLCEYEFLYFNSQNTDLEKADGYAATRNMALWNAIGSDKRCERVSEGLCR